MVVIALSQAGWQIYPRQKEPLNRPTQLSGSDDSDEVVPLSVLQTDGGSVCHTPQKRCFSSVCLQFLIPLLERRIPMRPSQGLCLSSSHSDAEDPQQYVDVLWSLDIIDTSVLVAVGVVHGSVGPSCE